MEKVFKGELMEDLISVIVPVYNVEKYLPECIESIINQTYKNLEIILIDDGSPDNSGKICDEYAGKDNRIKVIHKKNEGVSEARNVGMEVAKGNYLTFVDSDDWIESVYIETLLKTLMENKADYVTCGYNRVYQNEIEKINNSGKRIVYDTKEYLMNLLNVQLGYGFCHMKLIKRDIIGNNKFDKKLVVGEDAFFNIKLCKNLKKAVVIEEALYNYRFNSNSVVRKYDANYVEKYRKSMEAMYNYIMDEYKEEKEVKQCLYNYIAYHVLLIAVNYCFNPNNKNKIKSLKSIYNVEIFKAAIENSNYKKMSLSRKITLFSLKYKLCYLTVTICGVRQLQFNLRNKKGRV